MPTYAFSPSDAEWRLPHFRKVARELAQSADAEGLEHLDFPIRWFRTWPRVDGQTLTWNFGGPAPASPSITDEPLRHTTGPAAKPCPCLRVLDLRNRARIFRGRRSSKDLSTISCDRLGYCPIHIIHDEHRINIPPVELGLRQTN